MEYLPLRDTGSCKNLASNSITSAMLSGMSSLGGSLHSDECPAYWPASTKNNLTWNVICISLQLGMKLRLTRQQKRSTPLESTANFSFSFYHLGLWSKQDVASSQVAVYQRLGFEITHAVCNLTRPQQHVNTDRHFLSVVQQEVQHWTHLQQLLYLTSRQINTSVSRAKLSIAADCPYAISAADWNWSQLARDNSFKQRATDSLVPYKNVTKKILIIRLWLCLQYVHAVGLALRTCIRSVKISTPTIPKTGFQKRFLWEVD